MQKKIAAVLLVVFFATCGSALAGFMVRREVERRLDLKVSGKFIPVLFLPTFFLRDADLEWRGKIKVVSGNLKVSYNPVLLLIGRIHVVLSGRNLPIELLGDWAQMQGVGKVTLDRFKADLELSASGIRDIYFLEAESPGFQFHIKKSEN